MATNEYSSVHALPREILENILSNVSYEEVSNIRQICLLFDKSSQALLNQGFNRVEKFHAQIQKEVKAKLPRRESERRNHPLARHVDILAAIETRLSLLSMTYMKYIDSGVCCFIPGKVLDELYRVLWRIRTDTNPPRAHELLQELRDISSMAMEHFDENIAPDLKNKMPPMQLSLNTSLPGPSGVVFNSTSPLSVSYTVQTQSSRHPALKHDINQVKANARVHGTAITGLRKDLTECKLKIQDQAKKVLEQDKKVLDQNRVIAEQSRKISEQGNAISDLTSKLLSQQQKLDALFEKQSKTGDQMGPSSECCEDLNVKIRHLDSAKGANLSAKKRKQPLPEAEFASKAISVPIEPATKYPRRTTRSSRQTS